MKLEHFCHINPSEQLCKNIEYDFVEMADIVPGKRYVFSKSKKIFNGSFSKFSNKDTLMAKITPCLENGKISQFIGLDKAFGSTEFNIFREKKDISDNDYLYYLISSPLVKGPAIKSMSGATGRQRANLDKIKQIEVPDISIKAQQKIAKFLSNYDDLIENNNRRIKILEEMAQKIYKEWFVDFKFPGHETTTFKDSPLGKIPNDWEVLRLADIANITMGQSPKSEFYNENKKGLPFHQGVTNFGIRYPLNKIYCSCNGRIANSNDILLSVRAPVGRINITKDKMLIGRGLAAINSRNNNQTFLFYLLSKLFINEDQFGNGAVFNAITKEELSSLEVMYPSNKLITSFETIVKSLDILLMNLLHKNENLKQTRDILLPRLISGEINVENMEVL